MDEFERDEFERERFLKASKMKLFKSLALLKFVARKKSRRWKESGLNKSERAVRKCILFTLILSKVTIALLKQKVLRKNLL